LATSARLLIGEALQLSYDAHRIRAEVLVTADGLAGSAVDVLGLLLHEAGHALASERGVKDASRQGRYHNCHFKTIAEELGLDVAQDPPFGLTATALPAATAARYTDALAILGHELSSARGEFALSRRPRMVRSQTCRCGEHVRSGPRPRGAPGGAMHGVWAIRLDGVAGCELPRSRPGPSLPAFPWVSFRAHTLGIAEVSVGWRLWRGGILTHRRSEPRSHTSRPSQAPAVDEPQ
jgi:hypothetical protein